MSVCCNADPLGVYQPHSVDIVYECSNGEYLPGAAFTHHAVIVHHAHYAALDGFVLTW